MKAAPKSCGCRQCTRGKRSEAGKCVLSKAERKARRLAKKVLRMALRGELEDVVVPIAPHAGYTD